MQLSGKFAPQVANFLKARGVAQVQEQHKKGMLTKKDKAQHKEFM